MDRLKLSGDIINKLYSLLIGDEDRALHENEAKDENPSSIWYFNQKVFGQVGLQNSKYKSRNTRLQLLVKHAGEISQPALHNCI